MQVGAIIEKGPQNWQIIQQTDGFGDIYLEGTWVLPENVSGEGAVYVRVVREDSGDTVANWVRSEDFSGCRWKVTLHKIPAGGLYRIETSLFFDADTPREVRKRGDMIHHVGIGDLYVIAGQSNAAGYGKDPVYDPPEIGIHVYKNSGTWDLASHPLNESTDTIHEENREGGNPGHSPYINFARIIKRDMGYPIGLIQASLGGSALSAWNPEENGVLYRSMMNSIRAQGGRIKGVLWYQGCSDAAVEGISDTYFQRFERFAAHMREDLEDDSLPFLTVQLNRYVVPSDEKTDRCWGVVREAQRQAALKIPGVYIISAIDSTLSDAIHNTAASNMILGERLAKMALTELYGKKYICKSPDIACARLTGEDTVELSFNNVTGKLYAFEVGAEKLPFTVTDEAGEVLISDYELSSKNIITIRLERELKGKNYVHGAFQRNPESRVPVDTEGHLPMLSFYGVKIIKGD